MKYELLALSGTSSCFLGFLSDQKSNPDVKYRYVYGKGDISLMARAWGKMLESADIVYDEEKKS